MNLYRRYRFHLFIVVWSVVSIIGFCTTAEATAEYLICALLGQIAWVSVMWISIHTMRANEKSLQKARDALTEDHNKYLAEMERRYLRGVEHDGKAAARLKGMLDEMKRLYGDGSRGY